MVKQLELWVSPEQGFEDRIPIKEVAQMLQISKEDIGGIRILKKSWDARKFPVKVRFLIEVFIEQTPNLELPLSYLDADESIGKCVIIGCGPAGMFAALRLLEAGIKPIVLERGKAVRERRRDLALLNKEGEVNPDSNYCFGEGGAGTYSDGKLYTRSNKRGDIQKILKVFTQHGAEERIRYEAHPHIGTNKLPGIVSAMSETIVKHGGEIYFNEKVTDFELNNGRIQAVLTEHGKRFDCDAVILATGHSARDIFEMLQRKQLSIEIKPFALGVRIEHPQPLIDEIQYHGRKNAYLPPASYSLVEQACDRGVFSFCMCPGGIIAPAATAPGEVVVNGWSPSKRNGRFANSGMVVSLDEKDFAPYAPFGALAGLALQAEIEQRAFRLGGGKLVAPAQRAIDFVNKRQSALLPPTSYYPGVTSVELDEVLPLAVIKSLRQGLQQMGKKMKGYLSSEAILVATESRTSSPVRIPRDRERLTHPDCLNLYPCGEGAGYAGGIVSAAMDGERCAAAVVEALVNK